MGDKSKIKTGNLEANVMEESELSKRLGRIKRQKDYFVTKVESEQTALAKRFLSHLKRSTRIAEEKEAMERTFKSMRWNLAFESQNSGHLLTSSRKFGTRRELECQELKQDHGVSSEKLLFDKSPSHVLKRMSQQFEVPYKKIYSFNTSESDRPATVLDMRCKMWQRISFCGDKKERAKSACPPWAKNYKAPRHIQLAHYRALKHIGMKTNLVSAPSRQPQIDVEALANYRSREIEVEKRVISRFNESLEPYKIRPGPNQIVYDTSKLYGELAKLNYKLKK